MALVVWHLALVVWRLAFGYIRLNSLLCCTIFWHIAPTLPLSLAALPLLLLLLLHTLKLLSLSRVFFLVGWLTDSFVLCVVVVVSYFICLVFFVLAFNIAPYRTGSLPLMSFSIHAADAVHHFPMDMEGVVDGGSATQQTLQNGIADVMSAADAWAVATVVGSRRAARVTVRHTSTTTTTTNPTSTSSSTSKPTTPAPVAAALLQSGQGDSQSTISMVGVVQALRRLKTSTGSSAVYLKALSLLKQVLSKILDNPTEPRFKRIKVWCIYVYCLCCCCRNKSWVLQYLLLVWQSIWHLLVACTGFHIAGWLLSRYEPNAQTIGLAIDCLPFLILTHCGYRYRAGTFFLYR